MALRDSNRLGDLIEWTPRTAPASIYPVTTPDAQQEPGSGTLASFGGPLPFGLDEPEIGPEDEV